MAIKKSALYSSIWSSCDELRGGMDASQYKDYVLVLLFMKYVSDKHAGQRNALVEVPPGASYDDILALKGDKEIGDKINKIIARLAEANDLKGVIDQADFNDDGKLGRGKEMVDRLSNLVAIFDKPELDFRKNRAEDDDLLGDAYEYLMKNFATESGKSKGQFYTPAEVSRVMAQVIGVGSATSASQTIYDPTCGSGSLLIKAHDEALAKTGYDLTLYGQEMDNATYALARMNMILHGCATADIGKGNTLSNPLFRQGDTTLKTFDFVVANPPFSNKAWSSGLNPAEDVFGRFALGIPPKKNGDYAFLLHVLASMKSTGKGAIVMPHGVLFRGNVEAEIRRNVVKRGYIKGIIGLPANLFYGTGIPACIVVLDKENAFVRKGVFMIDASKGFIKDGNKNRLRAQDIYKIVSVFNNQVEVPGYSHMATFDEIEQNDFNLNIPRYIDSTEPEDLQDIDAHLNGGIPDRDIDDLERYWAVFPSLRTELFEPADRPGYSQLQVPASDIRSTIFGHPEFEAFNESVMALFEEWRAAHVRKLKDLGPGVSPKALISELSESLLNMFHKIPLIDSYDVYQHLMTYWAETMQDDVYLIVGDGWREAAKLRLIVNTKGAKNKEKPDITAGKKKYRSDLIPPALVTARFFPDAQAAIDELEAKRAALSQQMDELRDEHEGDEGFLSAVIGEDDTARIAKGDLTARLREIKDDPELDGERAVLEQYLGLMDQDSATAREIKDRRAALDAELAVKYAELTEDEVKALVVDDKWLSALAAEVQSELHRISQALTARIRELAERYESTLPELMNEVEALALSVEEHLKRMGAVRK